MYGESSENMKEMKEDLTIRHFEIALWLKKMDVSKNRGTPKWIVYNGKPY